MKEIKQYIEFAIDNGYECEHFFRIRKDGRFLYHKNEFGDVFKGENLIEAITSKEFIESIARGEIEILEDGSPSRTIEYLAPEIAREQGEAIYKGELEDFINNILN